jgi:CRISPR system Cascade subunit CasA
MSVTFNLIDQAWIDCMNLGGKPVKAGLAETLTCSHQLRGLSYDLPLAGGAILRLLLAILQRVFSLPDLEAWENQWRVGCWPEGPLIEYLSRWRYRFDLFDEEYPFYQTGDIQVEARNIATFLPGNSAGDFYHHAVGDPEFYISPPEAARWLVVNQAFGLPGICHPQKKLFFSGAPGVSGVMFFIEGDNLFQTLSLNLLRYNPEAPDSLLRQTKDDRPAWEREDPYQPERAYPLGFLDYLTWQNRKIKLVPEMRNGDMVVAKVKVEPGLRMAGDVPDPQMHLRKTEAGGLRPLQFREGRSLWRDSASLFQFTNQDFRPPLSIQQADRLVAEGILEPSSRIRILALGMASNQAKVEFYREEHLPFPAAFLENPDIVADLDLAIQQCENARKKLWGAVRMLARLLLSPESDLPGGRQPDNGDISKLMNHWGYDNVYWGALETPFWRLMVDLPLEREAALLQWQKTIKRAAWRALDQARRLAGESPVALKASVQAGNQLAAGLAKMFND